MNDEQRADLMQGMIMAMGDADKAGLKRWIQGELGGGDPNISAQVAERIVDMLSKRNPRREK